MSHSRTNSRSNSRPKRSRESGYALLMVLFMVSAMLLMAMMASPSILTEGRREKEQELVWRGNQYMRAIRLYYQKYGQYPQTVDDLMKGDATNVHYLRKAYTDPMSTDGKWRFIYVSGSGQLIGSVKYHTLQEMAGVVGTGRCAAVGRLCKWERVSRMASQGRRAMDSSRAICSKPTMAQQTNSGQQGGNANGASAPNVPGAPGDPNAQSAQQNGSQNGGPQQTSIQSGFGPQQNQFGGGQGSSGFGSGFTSGFQGQNQGQQPQGLTGGQPTADSQGFGSSFGSQNAGSGFGSPQLSRSI